MVTRIFVVFFLALVTSCKEEKDPLIDRLVGTTWVMDRVEILDQAGNLARTIYASLPIPLPTNPITFLNCSSVLYFRSDRYLVLGSSCSNSGVGCGEYRIGGGKISYKILAGQAVLGLCSENNFTNIFPVDQRPILLSDKSLIISGWNADFSRTLRETDGIALRDAYFRKEIDIRTVFLPTNQKLTHDLSCCGKL